MDGLFTFFCIMIGIACFGRAVTAKLKEKSERDLLERNPDAWKRLKDLEQENRNRKLRGAGGVAFTIFKILMKK